MYVLLGKGAAFASIRTARIGRDLGLALGSVGRSLAELITSLQELNMLGVGFVSLTEALDMATPTGRVMVGLLAVFAEFECDLLRERVKAGIAQARQQGKVHGCRRTVGPKQ